MSNLLNRPDDVLKEARGIALTIMHDDTLQAQDYINKATELAELFLDLDEHVRQGGALPDDWNEYV